MQKANNFSTVLMADKRKAEPGHKGRHEGIVKKSLEHIGKID